jgi:AraC family transcriptional activator of pobA
MEILNTQLSMPEQHIDFDNKWVLHEELFPGDFKVVHAPVDQHLLCQPYNRKGLFKISLHHGHNRIYYADKVIEYKEYAILFSRPDMVYRFEPIGKQYPGYFCVFKEHFFDQFAKISDYPLFKPRVSPLIEITAAQMELFTNVFKQMENEMAMDFSYKYDVLRTQVLQLILDTLKLQPAAQSHTRESSSSIRIATCFNELLEGQFPILNTSSRMHLRHPVEFADKLSVHVNHLNRSLKEVNNKTTSQLIADRIMREARILLQNTDWNIMDIAWCLGFEDLAHFFKFFKKNGHATPSAFRKTLVV